MIGHRQRAAAILGLLAIAPLARGVEPANLADDNVRQFAIQCRIIDATSGKQQVQLCPKITVLEHKKASITSQTQRPFVIAVTAAEGNSQQPCIEVFSEGWTIDLCCHANGKDQVTLDVTLEESTISAVEVIQLDDQLAVQSPRMKISKSRHIQVARGDEPLLLSLDGLAAGKSRRWAEFVVAEQDANAK